MSITTKTEKSTMLPDKNWSFNYFVITTVTTLYLCYAWCKQVSNAFTFPFCGLIFAGLISFPESMCELKIT